jgi:hypothetical protein
MFSLSSRKNIVKKQLKEPNYKKELKEPIIFIIQ